MTTTNILQKIGLNPSQSILSISMHDALERLLEFMNEWQLSIRVRDIGKQDWKTLFASYADAVNTYHPENDHQERAVFLKNEPMLKKYGLSNEDIKRLDFC